MVYDKDKPLKDLTPEEYAEAMADLNARFGKMFVDIAATNEVLGDCLPEEQKEKLSELWRETEEIERSVQEERDG